MAVFLCEWRMLADKDFLIWHAHMNESRIQVLLNIFKGIGLLFMVALLFSSCVTAKRYNAQISTPNSPENLRADVDYIHRRIEKLHPELYWYISKEELEHKFDSLKASIDTPMTSNEFYFRISPVIASVRQGHTRAFPVLPRKIRQERKALRKMDDPPLARYQYELFDNKLYVVKVPEGDSCIRVGAEILSANGHSTSEIFDQFRNTYTSDGYNTTLYPLMNAKQFPSFVNVISNQSDSVRLTYAFSSHTIDTLLTRQPKKDGSPKDTLKTKKPKEEQKLEQQKAKVERKKRKLQGYNYITKTYSKNLSFMEPDSSIAVMKINDFSRGRMRKFYKESFALIDFMQSRALVIDLRGNPGGKLADIAKLYSYLVDTSFVFIDGMEITSRYSFILGNYWSATPVLVKALNFTLGLPFYAGQLALIRKIDGKYYHFLSSARERKPMPNAFKGKVYVLIDGGSFSASSIISSNLMGSQRATFVGEETGGAFNGCVAGIMPVFVMPHSKIPVKFGLGVIRPHYKSPVDGRGIMPQVEIKPTLQDRISGKDPELEWVIDDVRQQAHE